MNHRQKIQKELKDLNSSLPFEKPDVYAVPDGYFDTLAAAVLSKVKSTQSLSINEELESLSPLLASIPRKVPFSVPDDYFNQNINNLSQQDFLPPFLAEHNRQMPFHIPSSYFQQLPEQVLSRVAKRPQAKIISFDTTRWMKYAAAAVVTGIIALSSILYFQNNKSPIDPVKHPHEWVARKLHNVSNEDLERFINTTDISTSNQQIAKKSNTDTDVRNLLGNVSNSELDAFLSQVPSDLDESPSIN